MTAMIEDTVEQAAIEWLTDLGYTYIHGPDIAPDQPAAERSSYRDVVLTERLHEALVRLNPTLPPIGHRRGPAPAHAQRKPQLERNNHRFHRLLVDGVPVAYQDDGRTVYTRRHVVDFEPATCLANNDWLAVNQLSVRVRAAWRTGGAAAGHPPSRHRALRQRPAPGRHRAQESRR